MAALARDPLGGRVFQLATELMIALVGKSKAGALNSPSNPRDAG
jgi:hypothetical protein